jgi:hypothetical protein
MPGTSFGTRWVTGFVAGVAVGAIFVGLLVWIHQLVPSMLPSASLATQREAERQEYWRDVDHFRDSGLPTAPSAFSTSYSTVAPRKAWWVFKCPGPRVQVLPCEEGNLPLPDDRPLPSRTEARAWDAEYRAAEIRAQATAASDLKDK